MNNLRPIGTEFDIEFIPNIYSTDGNYWKVITYRVKNHIGVARYKGDNIGRMVEEIEPIQIKLFHAKQRFFPGGQMIWEKGDFIKED